ncbi:chemotaxis-specific protein-glutamate methyltransferase [Paramagnetospirillum caucaseum]|uniref:Protein-glutamate methylesterase/protein-glutamine glutaminase n=2 Tax=Paramagnetospirillum caucaseum TaxID=1244869 RepID=M2Z5N6_9PROT|nr:chemotaxis-specific protein-glutamate methyltransferase [Paramagnetospirillum caucaseum]
MLVDDSAIVRGLVARILATDPAITVAAQVANGEQAIAALARTPVDVVVLDIEMPVMDGLTALPGILKTVPGVRVIMLSSLTQRGATVTFQALRAGAADYIPKPSAGADMSGTGGFKRELIDKIKSLAARKLRPAAPASSPLPRPAGTVPPRPAAIPPSGPVEVLAIGSSTGGPQALFDIFAKLRTVKPRIPILITQHMPPTFTGILAEHIAQTSGLPSAEGKDGEKIMAGRVYVAPGGRHMLAERKGGELLIRLSDAPPENFCKPAVDPMFRSVSAAWGNRAVAMVLTGMGSDGAKGGRVLAEAGGQLYAQDEATCVVYGMPAAAAQTGLCKAILPLGEIGDLIRKLVS